MPRYTFSPDVVETYVVVDEKTGESIGETVEADLSEFEKTPNGNYSQYEPRKAVFAPDDLEPAVRRVFDVVRELGVHTLKIRYDGGHDEGFIHFDQAVGDKGTFSMPEIIEATQNGPLGERGEQTYFYRGPNAVLSRAEWAEDALLLLMNDFATRLLGYGFGTGDHCIVGRFRANLRTGEIEDEPTTLGDLPPGQDFVYDPEQDEDWE